MSTTRGARVRRITHARTWAVTLAAIVTTASSCATDSDTGSASGRSTAPAGSEAPAERSSATTAVDPDLALAEGALLTPDDLEGNWRVTEPEGDHPMSAELARTAPACAPFADIVFEGGAQHGLGATVTLQREDSLVYTYVVVFPTSEEAEMMMRSVASTEFDDCWSQFVALGAIAMPFGITEAQYDKAEPPAMTFVADSYTIRHLIGTIVVEGVEASDTCVCVFAQVGRGVVVVHGALPHFSLEEREEITQTAIDKLRDVLR